MGYTLGVVSGSVLLAWLYNRACGSIFAVAVWHALFDFIVASPAGEGTIAAVTSIAVMLWAVIIVTAQFRQYLRMRAANRSPLAGQATGSPG